MFVAYKVSPGPGCVVMWNGTIPASCQFRSSDKSLGHWTQKGATVRLRASTLLRVTVASLWSAVGRVQWRGCRPWARQPSGHVSVTVASRHAASVPFSSRNRSESGIAFGSQSFSRSPLRPSPGPRIPAPNPR